MVEPGSDLYLSEKPIRSYRFSQLGPEDLDGNLAMVLDILGQVDDCHPPGTQLPLNHIAVGEGLSDIVEEVVCLHSVGFQECEVTSMAA